MPRFADPTTSPAVSNRQRINLMRDKTCVKLLLWRRNDNGLNLKLSANLGYTSFVSWACLVDPTKSRSRKGKGRQACCRTTCRNSQTFVDLWRLPDWCSAYENSSIDDTTPPAIARLENDGLENDGVEQEQTYILHTKKTFNVCDVIVLSTNLTTYIIPHLQLYSLKIWHTKWIIQWPQYVMCPSVLVYVTVSVKNVQA